LILYLQEQNQSWNVENTSLWIGSDKDCDLQLEAARYPDLSGKHVTIIADVGGRFAFRDHNSKYGTFKNGSRVSAVNCTPETHYNWDRRDRYSRSERAKQSVLKWEWQQP
jgi:hypothetical protein